MTETGSSIISELVWDQKRAIKNVKKNKNLSTYIYYSHLIILLCSVLYGIVLGFYAKNVQILFNSVKIPMLFLITLYITAPVIFIVDVLQDNRVTFKQVITLLSLGFNNTAVVLLAFSPLMLFFILTALDYSFIVLLNISICGFAGYFGLISMYTNFQRFHKSESWKPALNIGSFLIIFVGTQLAWTLRPFFNNYSEFIRPVSSNFYVALAGTLSHNPGVAFILFGVFALIAIIITINRFDAVDKTVKAPTGYMSYTPTTGFGYIPTPTTNVNVPAVKVNNTLNKDLKGLSTDSVTQKKNPNSTTTHTHTTTPNTSITTAYPYQYYPGWYPTTQNPTLTK
jgi:hypothetical protein